MPPEPPDRRTVLVAVGGTALSVLAGCSEVASRLPGDDSDSEADDGSNDGTDPVDAEKDELAVVIDDYFDAGEAGDTDALADVVHSQSFFHPDQWEESDWEFEMEPSEGVDYEIESATVDADIADVRELAYVDRWYDDGDLEETIGSGTVATVELASEQLESEGQDVWVLATEDDEWQVFLATTEDDAPEDPETALEEPIYDRDEDVVDGIEWDVEQETAADGEFARDDDWARVVLTESPGIDADTVRIESTIADFEMEFYSERSDGVSSSWAGNSATLAVHTEGDQIVVTAIDDGEETIVHREHYEP